MDDDVRHDDLECPKCGEWEVYSQECYEIGCDDGFIDGYDEDPLWYDPGDVYPCPTCGGHGILRWCHKCGKDLTLYRWPAETSAPGGAEKGETK